MVPDLMLMGCWASHMLFWWQDLVLAAQPHCEHVWTKGDIFQRFGTTWNNLHYGLTQQPKAQAFLMRLNERTVKLLQIWEALMTDFHLVNKALDGPWFKRKENRHDQSILSMILKASIAKSGSCNEPDFKCDRLGSDDETAGWEVHPELGVKGLTYGEVFEAQTGAVVTCLLDRREPRRSSISYCLNGRSLGAICRFQDLRFPHGGFSCLEEANRGHVADDGGAASAAAAVFAAAPFVEERELKQLDVPDENLVELRSDDGIDERELKSADFHAEFAEKMCIAVLAFTSHRVARSMLHAPPPGLQVSLRPAFSEEAQKILALRRPDKAATTDVVARRLIAGALDGDVKLTKEQLRQIRVKKSNTNSVSNRKVPPAPKMPTLETDTESGSSSDQMSQAVPAAKRAAKPAAAEPAAAEPALPAKRQGEGRADTRPKESRSNPAGGRLLAGALRGVMGERPRRSVKSHEEGSAATSTSRTFNTMFVSYFILSFVHV
eukprot:g3749.t1